MNQRLIHALQRGGVTCRIRADTWGVWRGTDRRRRMIGTLIGGEVDVLRLNGDLRAIDTSERLVFAWSEVRAPRALSCEPIAEPPLLDHLILRCPSRDDREHILAGVSAFRDAAQAESSASTAAPAILKTTDGPFLSALIMSRASKDVLAKTFNLRRADVDRRARTALRRLAGLETALIAEF